MKESFLEQTARSIVEHISWQQLSNTTLVLPSHRAGLVLKNELMRLQQEQAQTAIWSPDVKTLTQLQDSLSVLYAEDELFTIVRLYRHYLRLNANDDDLMPLDMFYGWGRQMLADFTNVDASMPAEKVENFFANTIAANTLEQLRLEQEVRERLNALVNPNTHHSDDSIYHRYAAIWDQLYELYKALRQELAAERKGYAGMRQRAVIEQWESEYIQKQIAGRMYVFVGFNYLLPVERELMQKLKDSNQAMFYWDYVPDFQTNSKAFYFARLNSELLGNNAPQIQAAARTCLPKQVTVLACSSREAQAQYVHSWLQANYTEHGQKVGVVIGDESMLESVIYTIPAITLPGETEPEQVNITKGFPLRNTQIFARVLGWLYDKARGDAEQVVTPAIIDELQAALLPDKTDDEPEDQNQSLNWKELLIIESEYQVRKITNQMRLLITNGLGDLPITLKLLRLLMRRAMENVTMPFHGEPITDIQIMGVLETRMMDFDKLLILNVEEGVIPQHQTDNSFIPFYLRKAYSMQTPDEKATIYAYNFFRLLSRAGQSTLLYTTTDGAENSKGMSRFVMQILVSPEFSAQKRALREANSMQVIDDDARLNTSGVSMLSLLEKGQDGILRRKGSDRHYRLSPSALNSYIECPRKFCLEYIQGLRGEDKEDIEFTPAELGSFVHEAMEYLYKTHLGCDNKQTVTVTPEQIDTISDKEHLDKALQMAYAEMNRKWAKDHNTADQADSNPLPDHYLQEMHLSENEIILTFIRNILERDKQDAAAGLQICLLETPRYFCVDVEGVGKVETGGIIDRLDIYGPQGLGRLRVVDYKSGAYDSGKLTASPDEWMTHPEKNYVRQTLMYSHAVMVNEDATKDENEQQPIEPNLFFCSRKLTGLRTTISIGKQTVEDYRDVQKSFIDSLRDKMREILTTTEFPPCEEKKCKSYCPFLGLCRRKVRDSNY